MARAAWGPDDVDVTIKHVEELLADPHSANDADTLTVIHEELIRARDAVGGDRDAINLIQSNLTSSLDAQIADYQTLVLEYAQYVDNATLAATIPAGAKTVITKGLSPSDVQVADVMLGGRGTAIRTAAGLPAP